jgi:hypothetical protein
MFLPYKDKTSDKKKYSRIIQGGEYERSGSKISFWSKRTDILKNQNDDIEIFELPLQYHKRPDLLAYDLYGRSDLMWVILQYNSIVDIEEEFIAGANLKLPSRSRVFSEIINKSVSYTNVNT